MPSDAADKQMLSSDVQRIADRHDEVVALMEKADARLIDGQKAAPPRRIGGGDGAAAGAAEDKDDDDDGGGGEGARGARGVQGGAVAL